MPETGQPGGAGLRGRSASTQAGQYALGSKGPFLRTYTVGNFAGNGAVVVKCPLGIRWNLVYLRVYVDTDGTVGDRNILCRLRDVDDSELCILLYGATRAANTAGYDTVGPSEGDYMTLSFPAPLVDGMQLYFACAGGFAGDLVNARFTVLEWKI